MYDAQSVLAFINTRRDRPTGEVELLSDPVAASTWLEHELGYAPGSPLSGVDHTRLLAVRGAVRHLIRARMAGEAADPADMAALNRACAAAPLSSHLGEDWRRSLRFAPSGAADPSNLVELLAALSAASISLLADPSADLVECGAEDCVVVFLRTDPRQRWHSERCGNRMRAARSYARHRAANR